jgi:hypothetical protein
MRKLWVLLVVAVVIGGVSTVAAAKPPSGTGRQIVLRTVTLTPPPPEGNDIIINEVVTCPQGTASVNGGYAWVTPPVGYDALRHVVGGPEGTDWRVVSGSLFVQPGSNNDFTLWAICVNT